VAVHSLWDHRSGRGRYVGFQEASKCNKAQTFACSRSVVLFLERSYQLSHPGFFKDLLPKCSMVYNVVGYAEKRFMHAGYCFRGDIPTEPFLITDFVEDAVKSCRSCGIDATRASTSLAREQLDMAMFFANSSLNCLCFLNDVHMTPEFWHKVRMLFLRSWSILGSWISYTYLTVNFSSRISLLSGVGAAHTS